MDTFVKILGLLDKPFHYLMLGMFLICWKYFLGSELDLYFLGGLLIVFSIASFVEKIALFLAEKFKYVIKMMKEKKEAEILRQYYINEYSNLNKREKEVIDYCIENKILVYEPVLYESDVSHIYSLIGKRLGQNVTCGGNFMINKSFYDTIICYLNEKKKTND